MIKRLSVIALVLGCLALPALAQTPAPAPPPTPTPSPTSTLTITGPATIPLYTLGQYTVSGDPTAKVAWLVMPNTAQVVSGQSLVMTGQSGQYTVIAFAVANGQPVILQQVVTIGQPTPAPTPTPTPTPAPNPTPKPTSGPFWVAFITDKTSTIPITGAQAALKQSTTIAGSLKALAFGNVWAGNLDVSTPTVPPVFTAAARQAGLPCLLILGTDNDGKGFVVEALANPTDEAFVIAEIQRLAAGGAPKVSMHRPQKKVAPEPVIPLWVDAGPSNNWFGYGSEKAWVYAAQTAIPAGD